MEIRIYEGMNKMIENIILTYSYSLPCWELGMKIHTAVMFAPWSVKKSICQVTCWNYFLATCWSLSWFPVTVIKESE